MKIKNIELKYNMLIKNIMAEYEEIHYPTYIEFFILSILCFYPIHDKPIGCILEEHFNIVNKKLFKNAIENLNNQDYIYVDNYDVFDVNDNVLNWTINDIKISEQVKTKIIQEDKFYYIIKKNVSFDIFADPFFGNIYFNKDEFKIKNYLKSNFKIELIKSDATKQININLNSIRDNFIKKFNLNGHSSSTLKFTSNNFQLEVNKSIEGFNIGDSASVMFSLLANGKNNFIASPVTNINISKDFLNKLISNEIIEQIKKNYNETYLNIIQELSESKSVEYDKVNSIGFQENELFTKFNIALINGVYVKNSKSIIDSTNIFDNVDFILVYNSKVSTELVQKHKGKIIINILDQINDIFNNLSICLLNEKQEIESFVVKKDVNGFGSLHRVIKNLEYQLSVNLLFSSLLATLNKNDYFEVKDYFEILELISRFKKTDINQELINYILKTVLIDNNSWNLNESGEEIIISEKVNNLMTNFIYKNIDVFKNNFNNYLQIIKNNNININFLEYIFGLLDEPLFNKYKEYLVNNCNIIQVKNMTYPVCLIVSYLNQSKEKENKKLEEFKDFKYEYLSSDLESEPQFINSVAGGYVSYFYSMNIDKSFNDKMKHFLYKIIDKYSSRINKVLQENKEFANNKVWLYNLKNNYTKSIVDSFIDILYEYNKDPKNKSNEVRLNEVIKLINEMLKEK